MIEIRNSIFSDRAELFNLWSEAFHDTDSYINNFFDTAYCDSHCRVLCVNKKIVSALYIIDCLLNGKKIAYIYAVATLKAYRGHVLYQKLAESTHEYLKALGYAGEILVPATKELFGYYEKLGYKTIGFADTFEDTALSAPLKIQKLNVKEYAGLRKKLLPENGASLGTRGLALLESIASFYATDNALFACETREGRLFVHEFLGDKAEAPAILAALDIKQGIFRTIGNSPFLMGYSLNEEISSIYFPFAFD
ncbi:MAG: GNAT family N-acetyltransferase [Clostridia bacterium]|nr:GNAT family N-acetyltransferase [Clostridia bacterium]